MVHRTRTHSYEQMAIYPQLDQSLVAVYCTVRSWLDMHGDMELLPLPGDANMALAVGLWLVLPRTQPKGIHRLVISSPALWICLWLPRPRQAAIERLELHSSI
ncbi:hypothetical protein GUJ93_ZPchr0007g5675 [Zizania palustris]|uniref:Uncharacterized protein n=1 Tax=Zizania palustris TaxID=103762 RepID=A0A8J5VSB4_ZIZPA|nr:hypothetical protein GUJ93_ZPchr0007g5675 [Zizania palustris]